MSSKREERTKRVVDNELKNSNAGEPRDELCFGCDLPIKAPTAIKKKCLNMSAILYDISAFLHYTIERADGQVDQVVSIVRAHI